MVWAVTRQTLGLEPNHHLACQSSAHRGSLPTGQTRYTMSHGVRECNRLPECDLTRSETNASATRDEEPTRTHTFVTSPSQVIHKLMTANHSAKEPNTRTYRCTTMTDTRFDWFDAWLVIWYSVLWELPCQITMCHEQALWLTSHIITEPFLGILNHSDFILMFWGQYECVVQQKNSNKAP